MTIINEWDFFLSSKISFHAKRKTNSVSKCFEIISSSGSKSVHPISVRSTYQT
jgi:hypothetical protein